MFKIILIFLSIVLLLTSCGPANNNGDSLPAVITKENEQTTINYIDDIIFLGESTTYHLKNRGVLSGGKNTKQVWGPKSGTLMLDTTIEECRIIYPDTGEEISLEEAIKRKKPKIMLLTFGLNGATIFIKRGESYFDFCYQKLIDLIKRTSPNTEIIINSCFPIAENMDMSHYTIDSKTLNSYIDTINVWAEKSAKQNDIRFINTSVILKNSDGYLSADLQAEDGYHLNTKAYKIMLNYLNDKLQNEEK